MSCEHQYKPCVEPKHYDRCTLCGTFHSTTALAPEELYFDGYWARQDRSLMQEQVWNVDMHTENGVSKNRFVLDKIESERGAALDIGCAPGRLLFWLQWAARFKRVVGLDPDNAEAIKTVGCFDGEMLTGLFPEAALKVPDKTFDLITGLDVFEHTPAPNVFLKECARLLKIEGQLLLMLPLAEDLTPDSRFFLPAEHVYIHSMRNLDTMLNDAGLSSGKYSRWMIGHDLVSARKVR